MIRLIIVHIGSENRIQLIIAIHSVFIQDGFQMGKVRLIRPHLIIEEIYFAGFSDLTGTVAAYGIHHQTLVGMRLLHGFDKRSISFAEVDRCTVVVVKRSPLAQLVDLIAVEGEVRIHVVIPFRHILLPFLVGRIYQIDIALPSAWQVVTVFRGMRSVLKQIPFFFHPVGSRILQCPETKIIEHGLHSKMLLCLDIILHRACMDRAVRNVEIFLVQLRACAAQRPMMFIVPVLKLYPVDVMAVQIGHLFQRFLFCLVSVEICHEAISGETCRMAGYIYRNRTDDDVRTVFLPVKFCHVSFEIGGRSLPCPVRTADRFFSDYFSRKAIAYLCSGGQGIGGSESHCLVRFIKSLVGCQFHA